MTGQREQPVEGVLARGLFGRLEGDQEVQGEKQPRKGARSR